MDSNKPIDPADIDKLLDETKYIELNKTTEGNDHAAVTSLMCPNCHSSMIEKIGHDEIGTKYRCKECGTDFGTVDIPML